ncbi:hypothetical protein B0H14DRAFT_3165642 [Mycena olivaceomarginata]|nr:hypothetical protein B0H14DRAFT_3165642 [Mycena olivaceomarginata]
MWQRGTAAGIIFCRHLTSVTKRWPSRRKLVDRATDGLAEAKGALSQARAGLSTAQLEETKTKGELAAARKKLSKMGAKLVRLKGELSMVKTKLLDAHDSLVVAQKNVNAQRSGLPRERQDERKKKRTNERKQKRAEKMGRLTKINFVSGSFITTNKDRPEDDTMDRNEL